mmetsp:Transcript_60048/g.165124  ORF Transcript_60048/g.165124 Transcript_60048/m.165124 type:complete len:217 (-) Transcript_60048:88-738(-)|eukprot:CAMPEP_0119506756 /NCGR_PEP_ID=MMETSP1344-20130328/26868_1 /TAXON_ID=236787 /ORGANISM="Florenciella parvula, Strain CCMP2471" /LENGTH=216 /DNA_ID=CAMNT_0007543325 /DNA_START=162 /DNA_END=812 /DNA_ORIENTATION=+
MGAVCLRVREVEIATELAPRYLRYHLRVTSQAPILQVATERAVRVLVQLCVESVDLHRAQARLLVRPVLPYIQTVAHLAQRRIRPRVGEVRLGQVQTKNIGDEQDRAVVGLDQPHKLMLVQGPHRLGEVERLKEGRIPVGVAACGEQARATVLLPFAPSTLVALDYLVAVLARSKHFCQHVGILAELGELRERVLARVRTVLSSAGVARGMERFWP